MCQCRLLLRMAMFDTLEVALPSGVDLRVQKLM
jgi:hypothetical protein